MGSREYHVHEHVDEIENFNKNQSAKFIQIKRRRLEKENAKKVARERIKAMTMTLTMLVIFSSMFAMVIYKNSLVNEQKLKIFDLKKNIKTLNTQIEELETQIEDSTDIKTVEKIAKESLNMQYPNSDQYVYINAQDQFAVSEETLAAQAEQETEVATADDSDNYDGSVKDTIAALFKIN